MASPPNRPNRSFLSRTTLITAAAIVGVLAAGSVAIAANIGILNAADSSPIGELAATDDLTQPTATAVAAAVAPSTTPAATTSTTATPPSASPAEYVVDVAGTVVVVVDDGRLALLRVTPTDGWTALPGQDSTGTTLTVTFDDGTRTIVFTGSVAADGSIVADVSEPITVQAPAATPASPTAPPSATVTGGSYDDDDHGDDDHDDDDHDDDEHEYEGRDDDD